MSIVVVVLQTVLIFGGPQPAAPPQPPPPSGLVLGRVVDAPTNRPVAGAIVTLGGITMGGAVSPGTLPRAMTNANGQFVFRKLPKGSFALMAEKIGYAEGAYGRRKPDGSSILLELEEGQRTGDVTIRLWRHGSISGTVVDEAGEPLADVHVRAFVRRFVAGQRRFTAASAAVTDDRGVYRFGALPPGEYVVGYTAHEVSVPAATAELLRNPQLSDPKIVDLMRERQNVDGFIGSPGSPYVLQIGAQVRQLDTSGPVPPPSVDNGPVYIYPTQFYPAAASTAKAGVIALASGQQRDGIDLTLHPARAVSVSGIVVGPDGPVPNTALTLLPADDDARTDLAVSATMSGSVGEFTFLGVAPGPYVIKVLRVPQPAPRPPSPAATTQIQLGTSMLMMSGAPADFSEPDPVPDGPTMSGEAPVAVASADLSGVLVILQKGARIIGHYEFEGTRDRPAAADLPNYPIMVERWDGGPTGFLHNEVPPGRADRSGAFTTYGVPPGRYLVRLGHAPWGWIVKSVTIDGRDASEVPVDLRAAEVANAVITFSDRPAKLTGTVRAPDGRADPDALVIVFPIDPSAWRGFGRNPRRLRSARSAQGGVYAVEQLPAGEYYVAAIREEAIAEWQDPQLLDELARTALQVKIADGETLTIPLRSGGARR